jgi:hypothetical protein
MWFSTTAGRLYGNTNAGFGLESHGEMLMSAAVLQCKERIFTLKSKQTQFMKL